MGEGDHRPDLEAEIERRGLGERVRMHGYVDEETKADLYGRAWVNLTASQSEGWSLTVMEAALCGTPSAALAVGGLAESIVDGETGFLADDLAELTERVQRAGGRSPSCASASARRRRAARAHVHLGPLGAGVPRRAAPRRGPAGGRRGRTRPPVSLNGHGPDAARDERRSRPPRIADAPDLDAALPRSTASRAG